MRHATDSDHVVAVTTIVSRQGSIWSAVWTGIFWGIGHSLTLLVIGGAIILFGVVVPQRLGMSLEFCVALMLILLGALNLRVTFRTVENISADNDHDLSTNTPISMAIMFTSTPTGTNTPPTVMPRKRSHRKSWIAGLAARNFTRRCARS